MSWSVKISFFPKEAEKHGVSATLTGIISSLSDWVPVFLSPILGMYLPDTLILLTAKVSPFIISTPAILWFALPAIEHRGWFITAALILRLIHGAGNSILFVTSSTLVTKCFIKTDGVISIILGAIYVGVIRWCDAG